MFDKPVSQANPKRKAPNVPDKADARPAIAQQLKETVHRKKQRNFCVDAADRVLKGQPVPQALIAAVKDNFSPPYATKPQDDPLGRTGVTPYSDAGALKKANQLMEKPWVLKGMEMLFADAGLSPAAAASKHVEHIKGIAYQDAKGMTIKLAPNYSALKDYWALTVPKAPTRLEVRSASLIEMVEKPGEQVMASRSLKKVQTRETH